MTVLGRHGLTTNVRFGNALPISLIAGPCQMESREHAFMMAGRLKEICARLGIGLVYVSTDFVFDGKATSPIREDAPTAPLSGYGWSKWLGEQAVQAHGRPDFYTLRTSWVFGPKGKNFPAAILARAR